MWDVVSHSERAKGGVNPENYYLVVTGALHSAMD